MALRYRFPFLVKATTEIKHSEVIGVAACGHAGDGSLHVTIIYLRKNFAEKEEAYNILEKVYGKTLEMGESLTGEHNVGITVKDYLGSADDRRRDYADKEDKERL